MVKLSNFENKLKVFFRYLLGVIFLISGISKIISPENFINEIGRSIFFSSSLDTIIAYTIILAEITLALLIFFKFNKWVLNLTILTLVIFCCYLVYKIISHDNSDCGCFGNFIYQSNLSALNQDIFLIIISVYLYE